MVPRVNTALRVPWSGASFLAYLGGLTIFFATGSLLGVLANDHGAAGFALLSLFVLAVSLVLAFTAKWNGHPVTAGLLALTTVLSVVVFVGSLLARFGWLDDPDLGFHGFHLALLVLELVAVIASAFALAIFRFPLLVLFLAGSAWYFGTDLISGGGDWTAIVPIAIGLLLLAVSLGIDASESRPYGFWLHVVAGLTIGGGLLWFFHDGTLDWIVVGLAGLLYIALGDAMTRSSWIVLGAWGFLQSAEFFADKWSNLGENFFFLFPLTYIFPFGLAFEAEPEGHAHQWVGALVFVVTGLFFIVLALYIARRRRDTVKAAELL
jgi:hypothetical protein